MKCTGTEHTYLQAVYVDYNAIHVQLSIVIRNWEESVYSASGEVVVMQLNIHTKCMPSRVD